MKLPRRWFRFSLRSLLLATVLLAAGGALGRNWEAWINKFRSTLNLTQIVLDDSYVAFTKDGARVIAVPSPHTFVFDASTGKELLNYELASNNSPRAFRFALSQDGSTIVYQHTAAGVLDAVSGEKLRSLPLDFSRYLKVTNGGKHVFSFSWAGNAAEINVLDDTNQLRVWKTNELKYSQRFSIASDGSKFLDVGEDDDAACWSATTGNKLNDTFPPGSVTEQPEFSPDGTRVVGILRGNVIAVADATTGERLLTKQISAPARLKWTCMSADNRRIAATASGISYILDASSGEILQRFDEGGPCAFSADGYELAICHAKVSVWRRRHDEGTAGHLKMPELWLTVIFGIALVISLKKDRERFRAQS